MALDSTIAGSSANSYVTLAEANAYFTESFNKTSWSATVPADSVKENLLKESTRIIDTYYDFIGQTSTSDQALKWPRTGVEDDNGRYYKSDEIPSKVKIATYELAYYILEAQGFALSENDYEKIKVGTIQIDYSMFNTKSKLPKIVTDTLSSLGISSIAGGGVTMARLVRT